MGEKQGIAPHILEFETKSNEFLATCLGRFIPDETANGNI
jgi:hypothetical protein